MTRDRFGIVHMGDHFTEKADPCIPWKVTDFRGGVTWNGVPAVRLTSDGLHRWFTRPQLVAQWDRAAAPTRQPAFPESDS